MEKNVEAQEEYRKNKAKASSYNPEGTARKGWSLQRRRIPQVKLGNGGDGLRARLARWLSLLKLRRVTVSKLTDAICSYLIGESLVKELQNKNLDSKDLRSRVIGELAAAAACI